jgi:hypothetical protein
MQMSSVWHALFVCLTTTLSYTWQESLHNIPDLPPGIPPCCHIWPSLLQQEPVSETARSGTLQLNKIQKDSLSSVIANSMPTPICGK